MGTPYQLMRCPHKAHGAVCRLSFALFCGRGWQLPTGLQGPPPHPSLLLEVWSETELSPVPLSQRTRRGQQTTQETAHKACANQEENTTHVRSLSLSLLLTTLSSHGPSV